MGQIEIYSDFFAVIDAMQIELRIYVKVTSSLECSHVETPVCKMPKNDVSASSLRLHDKYRARASS